MQLELHKSLFKIMFSGRMLVALQWVLPADYPFCYHSLLQAWMKEAGVDLAVIGLMALVGLPYTVKFLWAPFLDRYTLPFLGRRRGWLLIAQISLIMAIAGLGLTEPGKESVDGRFCGVCSNVFQRLPGYCCGCLQERGPPDEELGLARPCM